MKDNLMYIEKIDSNLNPTERQLKLIISNERKKLATCRLQQVRIQSTNNSISRTEHYVKTKLHVIDGIARDLEKNFENSKLKEIERLDSVKEKVRQLRGISHLDAQHLNICKKEIVERVQVQLQYSQEINDRRARSALSSLQQEALMKQIPKMEKIWLHENIMRKERAKAHKWTLHYQKYPPEVSLDEILYHARPTAAARALIQRRQSSSRSSIVPFDVSNCHRNYAVTKCDRNCSNHFVRIVDAKQAATIESKATQEALAQKRLQEEKNTRKASSRFKVALNNLKMENENINLAKDLESVQFGYRQYLEQFSGMEYSRLNPILAPSESKKLESFKRQFVS